MESIYRDGFSQHHAFQLPERYFFPPDLHYVFPPRFATDRARELSPKEPVFLEGAGVEFNLRGYVKEASSGEGMGYSYVLYPGQLLGEEVVIVRTPEKQQVAVYASRRYGTDVAIWSFESEDI